MAATPSLPPTAAAVPEPCLRAAVPRAMSRCECSGTPFAEVARQVLGEERSTGEVLRRTGCGQTCGACVPDLRRFLAQRA